MYPLENKRQELIKTVKTFQGEVNIDVESMIEVFFHEFSRLTHEKLKSYEAQFSSLYLHCVLLEQDEVSENNKQSITDRKNRLEFVLVNVYKGLLIRSFDSKQDLGQYLTYQVTDPL